MESLDRFYDNRVKEAIKLPESKLPEPNDKINTKKQSLFTRIISFILMIALIFFVIYIFLHPVDKIKVKFFLLRNCTLETFSAPYPYQLQKGHVYIDRNVIKIGNVYYEIKKDKLNQHIVNNKGEMIKTESRMIESLKKDIESSAVLFNSRNYERVKGELFVWRLKEGVGNEVYLDAIVKRENGWITIAIKTTEGWVNISFTRFGRTLVDRPWK